MRRRGLSLIELLVVCFIIGVIIAMLVPAVYKVRATTLRTQSAEKLKRIILGMHRWAADHDAYLPGYPRKPSDLQLFYCVLPYLDADFCEILNENNALHDKRRVVDPLEFKTFLDPADWSVAHEHFRATMRGEPDLQMLRLGKWQVPSEYYGGLTSYAANGQVFQTPLKLPAGFGDGTANTIAIGQHYAIIRRKTGIPGIRANPREMVHFSVWEDAGKASNSLSFLWRGAGASFRYSSFANSRTDARYNPIFDDIYPVTKNHVTTGSIPDLYFQANPPMEDADPRICQSPYNGGMLVAMADASVRFMAHSIKPDVYWTLVTPNGREMLNDDWLDLSPEIPSQPKLLAADQIGKVVLPSKKEPPVFDAEKISIGYSIKTPLGQSLRSHHITDQKRVREIVALIEIKEPETGTKIPTNPRGQLSLEFPGNKFTNYQFLEKDKLRRFASDFDGPDGYYLRNSKLYEKLCQICSQEEGRPIDILEDNK
jgi:hypothetical protein